MKHNWKQIRIKIIMERWKRFTKSKLQYFLNIFGAEKVYKRTQTLRRKREFHRIFLVYFLLNNSFVLPQHGN